jgi:hypothetical protein
LYAPHPSPCNFPGAIGTLSEIELRSNQEVEDLVEIAICILNTLDLVFHG